jgi:hypothetical protein
MEMEQRVNLEMSNRYRCSVITSTTGNVTLSDAVQAPSQLITQSSSVGTICFVSYM